MALKVKSHHNNCRGLINLIGPKLNPPPTFGKCMESNFQFFRKWEEEFGEKLYKSESLIRIFTSQKQANKWIDLTKNETTSKYTLSLIPGKKLEKLGIKAKYGAGETKVSRLNIENFLRLSQLKLKSINSGTKKYLSPRMAVRQMLLFSLKDIMFVIIHISIGSLPHKVKYWN